MAELDRKKFVLDTFFISFPSIVGLLSGFIMMIFITKFIGAKGFGIWTQFQATFSLVSPLLCLNFGSSIPRFLAGDKEKEYLSKVFYSVLFSILIFTILTDSFFYIFRKPLAEFLFGERELGIVVVFLIFFLIFKNLSNQGEHLLTTRRYAKEWTLISLGVFLVTTGLVSLTAVVAKNIVSAIAVLVIIEGIVLGFFVGFIWKKGISPVRPDFNSITPLLKFGIPLMVANLGYWIIQSSDRYLIKYFLDISQVGIYSVGYSLAFILIFFWNTLRGVLLPDLSALFDQGKTREFEIRFSRVFKYGVALSVPGVLGISLLAKPIIETFSSPEFMSATDVLAIIAIGVFFFGIFLLFTTLLSVLKKATLISAIWIFMAILNVGLNFWLIPSFGIIGAAYSTSIVFLLGALVIIFYSRKYFKIIFKKEWLAKIIIGSVFMGAIISLIRVTSLIHLILTILAGALIYGLILLFLKFYDESELLLFKKSFLRK